jgi:hypothetical protein
MHNEEMDVVRERKAQTHNYLATGLINAYVEERLKPAQKKLVESQLAGIEGFKEEVSKRVESEKFIKELIPNFESSKPRISFLRREFADINDSILGEDKVSLTQKIAKILDTTIIEF